MAENELSRRLHKVVSHSRVFRNGVASFALILASLIIIGQTGCKSEQPKQASAQAPVIVQPYQRFLPIAQGQGFLSFPYWAFDTQTGQLCKTWDWQSNSAASQKAQETGNASSLKGLDAAAAATTTCKQLWAELPTEKSISWKELNPKKQDPLGLFSK